MFPSAYKDLHTFEAHLLILCILLFSFICVSVVSAKTWYIKADGTGDAPTIQAGIDSAMAEDTILVAPGSYHDEHQIEVGGGPKTVNVFVYKNIALLAEEMPENTIIGNSRTDIAIYILDVDSTAIIQGFKIQTSSIAYGCCASRLFHPTSI